MRDEPSPPGWATPPGRAGDAPHHDARLHRRQGEGGAVRPRRGPQHPAAGRGGVRAGAAVQHVGDRRRPLRVWRRLEPPGTLSAPIH